MEPFSVRFCFVCIKRTQFGPFNASQRTPQITKNAFGNNCIIQREIFKESVCYDFTSLKITVIKDCHNF